MDLYCSSCSRLVEDDWDGWGLTKDGGVICPDCEEYWAYITDGWRGGPSGPLSSCVNQQAW